MTMLNKDKIVDTILIFSLTFFFAYPIYLCGINAFDEGTLLHIAERITKGEVLYRDIATGLMPGIYYLQAILFLVFDYSVEVGRYLQMGVLATNAAVLYLISCRFMNRGGSIVVTMLFVVTNAFVYRFLNYCPLSILFILLGFLCFLYHLSQQKNTYILLSGFCLAISFLFKQNYGVLVFLPLTFLLMVKAVRSKSFKPLILFLIAFTLPILLTMTYFYFHGALDEMVKYTFFSLFSKGRVSIFYKPYPFFNLNAPLYFIGDINNYTPFPYLTYWLLLNGFVSEEFICCIISVAYLVPPLIFLVSFIYLGTMFIKKGIEEKEVALLFSSIGLFWGVFPRSDFHHLAIVLPLLLILGGFIMQRVCKKGVHYIRILSYVSLFFIAFPFIFSAYLPVFSHSPIAQDTTLSLKRAKGIKVGKVEAETIKAITRYLKEKTKEDEDVLAMPFLPLYYFLSDRRNPTPYPLILPGSFDEDIFLHQISKATYIVYSDIGLDDVPFSTIFPRIYQYLSANFVVDKEFLSTLSEPLWLPVYVLKRGEGNSITSGLIQHLKEANSGIIKQNSGLSPLEGRDLRRIKQMPWFFKDSIAFCPPWGFRKLFLNYKIAIPSNSSLSFSLALREPRNNIECDGAVFDVYIYDIQSQKLLKMFTKQLDPLNPGTWRWEDFAVDLSQFSEREVILFFVCFSGPTLDELCDEVFLGQPTIVTDKKDTNLKINATWELPNDIVNTIGDFNEPGIFEQAINTRMDNPEIFLNLGRVYANLGRYEDALALLNRAVKLFADDVRTHSALAELYWTKGDALFAKNEYEKVLEKDKNNLRALIVLAEINLSVLQDFQQVFYYLKKATKVDPSGSVVHTTMGRVCLAMGNTIKASKEFKKALEISPDNSDALYYINNVFQGEKLIIKGTILSRAKRPLLDNACKADIKPGREIPEVMDVGRLYTNIPIRVKNISTEKWPAFGTSDGRYRVAVGFRWFDNNGNPLPEEGWSPLPKDIESGTEVVLNINIKAPSTSGDYLLKIDMLETFVGWFGDKGKETQVVKSAVRVNQWN